MDLWTGIQVYAYKKGNGIVPSDVEPYGNTFKTFDIKVLHQQWEEKEQSFYSKFISEFKKY